MIQPLAVRGELAYDTVRVYINDLLHIDFRRSAFCGLNTWLWPKNYKIEIILAGAYQSMRMEYDKHEIFVAVLGELQKLPLNGE